MFLSRMPAKAPSKYAGCSISSGIYVMAAEAETRCPRPLARVPARASVTTLLFQAQHQLAKRTVAAANGNGKRPMEHRCATCHVDLPPKVRYGRQRAAARGHRDRVQTCRTSRCCCGSGTDLRRSRCRLALRCAGVPPRPRCCQDYKRLYRLNVLDAQSQPYSTSLSLGCEITRHKRLPNNSHRSAARRVRRWAKLLFA